MPVNVAASPILDSKNKDGEKVSGRQRRNVPTGVVVQVEKNIFSNWNLSSIIRELAQNLSDACIRAKGGGHGLGLKDLTREKIVNRR